MLPLNDITQLAIKVQSATAERENTAVRVGTAIAELCKYVNQLPTVAGFSFVASANGVDLVIKTLTENGQEASTAVAVPLLSAEKAGMLTPQMLTALRADLRKDFVNFDKQVRDLIRASEEVMSRPLGELAQKVEETETAISQLNSEILRLDSFVRISCNEERGAVEQLLGAIEREEQGRKVFYLSKFIPEAALEAIRAKFPTLKIEQPPFSVVKYHDAVPTGTFATNHENQTGVEYGKPYECSGHVKRILDNRFRVMLRYVRSGVKKWVRLNPENPLLSVAGETINYDGYHGWPFVHEPQYWYKGVNDHLNAAHYAVFSSFASEPPRPEGKRLELSALEKTVGVRISGNDTFTTYAQFKETLSGHSSYKVSVEGFRFVRIPVTANADDAIAVFDKGGRVLQRINPSALEGVYSGSYVVVPLAEGADFVAFSLIDPVPADVLANVGFVWLTASSNPADWEPEWVKHEARFVSFCSVQWDNDMEAAFKATDANLYYAFAHAFIGTRTPTGGYGINVLQVLNNTEAHPEYDAPRYEDFKDLMQLYYARFGTRNAEMRLNCSSVVRGTTTAFHVPHEAYTRFVSHALETPTVLPDGRTTTLRETLFMGYAFNLHQGFGVFTDTTNKNGFMRQGTKRSAEGRYIPFPAVEKSEVVKFHTNGRYLDITVAGKTAAPTSDFYATYPNQDPKKLGESLSLSIRDANYTGNLLVQNNNVFTAVGEWRIGCSTEMTEEVATYADLEA